MTLLRHFIRQLDDIYVLVGLITAYFLLSYWQSLGQSAIQADVTTELWLSRLAPNGPQIYLALGQLGLVLGITNPVRIKHIYVGLILSTVGVVLVKYSKRRKLGSAMFGLGAGLIVDETIGQLAGALAGNVAGV